MKIAMLCPQGTPYVVGGAERLWEGIVEAINTQTDNVAAVVGIAAPESSFAELVHSYANFDTLDLSSFDVVISGKYPAWMATHPRHVVYMCHPLRGLYDTYDPALPQVSLPESLQGRALSRILEAMRPGDGGARKAVLEAAIEVCNHVPKEHVDLAFPGPLIRDLIRWLDADALHPSRVSRYLAISGTVARRPGYFPSDADVHVVVPPSGLRGLGTSGFGSFFTASRLDRPKRIDLVIAAMEHVPGAASLRIAGSGPAEHDLRVAAAHDPRIEFLGRISDQQLVNEYASALAVPFVPYDEDLGLITLEAQMSGKAVITCTDSGGTAELVQDGVDGFVVEPTPTAIGQAMARLVDDRRLASLLGRHGRRRAEKVTWDLVVEAILAEPKRSPAVQTSPKRRQIVALSTYSAHPARHGGQIRINRLYSALAQQHDVHMIALVDDSTSTSCQVSPGFVQTVVRDAPAYHRLRDHLSLLVGAPAGDIAASLTPDLGESFSRIVHRALSSADAVILPHPYLYPAVRAADSPIPLIYDAHNAEWSLKSSMYPGHEAGRALAHAVARLEAAVLRRATAVTVVSEDDKAKLDELTGTLADFAIVPNGGDFQATAFVSGEERRVRRAAYLRSLQHSGVHISSEDLVVFVGSGHNPNIEAAIHVLHAARCLPDVTFVLVGTHVPGLGGTPVGRNVIARGAVSGEELQLLLSVATVAVNPMTSGSGTNIKMLDYLAAGTPVVATTIGARGLPTIHGRDLLICETDDLADTILTVVRDPLAADSRAIAGRKITEEFDWNRLGRQFADFVHETLGARP